MSSLAATQADGYYLPVAYYESGAYKNKSKNDWYHETNQQSTKEGLSTSTSSSSNKEKKRQRRRTTVQFELPESGVCQGCGATFGKGTSFSAVKTVCQAEQPYFTSQLVRFHCTCRACGKQAFAIGTDPASRSFVYLSGITKVLRLVVVQPPEQEQSTGEQVTEIDQLQQQQTVQTELEQLQALQTASWSTYRNDADGNAAIRSAFRKVRRERQRLLKNGGTALGWRFDTSLQDAQVRDRVQAATATHGNGQRQERQRWKAVRQSGIFGGRKSEKKRQQRSTTRAEDKASPPQPEAVADCQPDFVSSSGCSGMARRKRKADIATVDLTRAATQEPLVHIQRKCRIIQRLVPGGSTLPVQREVVTKTATGSTLDALLAAYDSDD